MKRFICAIGLSVVIALLLEPALATRAGRLDKESLLSLGDIGLILSGHYSLNVRVSKGLISGSIYTAQCGGPKEQCP
jgi:hypothetical protein